jgi:hypothetical protein
LGISITQTGCSILSGDAAENQAVDYGATAQSTGTMNAAGDLTGGVQSRNGSAVQIDHLRSGVD